MRSLVACVLLSGCTPYWIADTTVAEAGRRLPDRRDRVESLVLVERISDGKPVYVRWKNMYPSPPARTDKPGNRRVEVARSGMFVGAAMLLAGSALIAGLAPTYAQIPDPDHCPVQYFFHCSGERGIVGASLGVGTALVAMGAAALLWDWRRRPHEHVTPND
jgi:hypothetical protein